jgi:hypothetical protein
MTDVTKLIGVLATMRTLLTTFEPKRRTLGRVCIKQQRVKLSTFLRLCRSAETMMSILHVAGIGEADIE